MTPIIYIRCYPFGMLVPGRYSTANDYRYGFQGQEKDNEIKGEGNSLNYTFRMHDPRVGRFFAIDPLAPQYAYNSPYAFSENRVLDAIELEGLEKYLIHTRSFVPFESFGPLENWFGDNRGFTTSTNRKTTSRLSMLTAYDVQTNVYSTEYSGSISIMKVGIGPQNSPIIAESEPDQTFTTGKAKSVGNRKEFSLHISGNDDAVISGMDGTFLEDFQSPDIDLHQDLKFNLSKDKTKMQVSGKLYGDAFPNAESFIEDAKGTRIFLQTFTTKWGPQEGPSVALWGDSERPMGDFIIDIHLDQDGNFSLVSNALGDGKKMSIEEYNKQFKTD